MNKYEFTNDENDVLHHALLNYSTHLLKQVDVTQEGTNSNRVFELCTTLINKTEEGCDGTIWFVD